MLIYNPGEASAFGTGSMGYVAVRSMLFIALLLVIGATAFQQVTLRIVRHRGRRLGMALARAADRRASGIAVAASALLLAAVLGRLVAQLYATADLDEGVTRALTATLLFRTPWGWGWLVQLSATALALVSYLLIRRTGRGTAGAVLATLVLAVTPMLSGHAVAAAHFPGLTVTAGTIHVLGASGWLGTLAVILLAGVPAANRLDPVDRHAAVAELVSAFSPAALVCAGLVVVSGTFVTWVHLGTGIALWKSEYGRLLLIKLAVFGVAAGFGAYNWRLVRPRLGNDIGTGRLRRHATLELIVAVAVVVITAVLVAVPLPGALGGGAAR
jgi:putative copper export protein